MSVRSSLLARRHRAGKVGIVAALVIGIGLTAVNPATTSIALNERNESTSVFVTPTRVLDSRQGTDVGLVGRFVGTGSRKLQITGQIETYDEATEDRSVRTIVPAGASGVILNVTVVNPTARGYLSVRPGDATGLPSTSSVNFLAGQVVPNAVNVALPTDGPNAGKIDITYMPTIGATTDVVVDIVGYTSAATITLIAERLDFMQRIDPRERTIFASGSGTAIENGDGLEEVVQYIDDLPVGEKTTGANPWLIKVEPGEYLVDTLDLPGWVRLEGAGVDETRISSLGSAINIDAGPVTIADLTVIGNGPTRPTVDINDESTRLERVDIRAEGGATSAVDVSAADVVVIDSRLTATGTGSALIATDSTMTLDRSEFVASDSVAVRADTAQTIFVDDSVFAGDLGGFAIGAGQLEISDSTLSGTNGLLLGSLPNGGSIDVHLDHSDVSRIFYNGGTPSVGSRNVRADYSVLGAGFFAPSPSNTRATLRHNSTNVGAAFEFESGFCTATVVGNTFAPTGCF